MGKLICKFCKVECHRDGTALLGKEHKKCCPRRKK
jgi:hypothetical protein